MTRSTASGLWARVSLRGRVLLLAITLLAFGLTAFGLVSGNALRGHLQDRLDTQLRATAQVFALLPAEVTENRLERIPQGPAGPGTNILGNPLVSYVSADGTVLGTFDSLSGPARSGGTPGPELPSPDAAEVTARGGTPFTLGSQDSERWRVIAIPGTAGSPLTGGATAGPGQDTAGSVIVAMSMAEVDGTVERMWLIFRAAGLGLLAALAVAGWFAVRSGLRPLSRVEQTAAEIAGGDLTRRVPELGGPNTELGRLAAALNGMLGQLETAFAARAESEARMSRFVADANHELRTPLAAIKGLTDLHRMGALAGPQETGVTMSRIARECERLTHLVRDMLLLAHLDEHSLRSAGGQSGPDAPGLPPALDLAPTDLRTLAAEALRDIRALDPERAVCLTGPGGDGSPSCASALADEARLRQVVTNLVGNAITHTPPGTPVRVGVGTIGEHAVLEVADQGPGLTEEQRQHIFERFYRADTSRTRATGGAGLGLPIVQSLVTAHAGSVEVDSSPGHGAVFRVLLPTLTGPGPT